VLRADVLAFAGGKRVEQRVDKESDQRYKEISK